jgi:hypothetical protein
MFVFVAIHVSSLIPFMSLWEWDQITLPFIVFHFDDWTDFCVRNRKTYPVINLSLRRPNVSLFISIARLQVRDFGWIRSSMCSPHQNRRRLKYVSMSKRLIHHFLTVLSITKRMKACRNSKERSPHYISSSRHPTQHQLQCLILVCVVCLLLKLLNEKTIKEMKQTDAWHLVTAAAFLDEMFLFLSL